MLDVQLLRTDLDTAARRLGERGFVLDVGAFQSLENQRNLKLAIHRDPVFLSASAQVADEMNTWAHAFFGRPIVADWRAQLDFTTKIFRARGLHLDDRHVRRADGAGFSASIEVMDGPLP